MGILRTQTKPKTYQKNWLDLDFKRSVFSKIEMICIKKKYYLYYIAIVICKFQFYIQNVCYLLVYLTVSLSLGLLVVDMLLSDDDCYTKCFLAVLPLVCWLWCTARYKVKEDEFWCAEILHLILVFTSLLQIISILKLITHSIIFQLVCLLQSCL